MSSERPDDVLATISHGLTHNASAFAQRICQGLIRSPSR